MKEKINMTKLFVATPMYGGQCFCTYLTAILNLYGVCAHHGIEFQLSTINNESLIPRARNGLVSNFLKTDFTHLLFIDADIEFNAFDIIKLIDCDKDLICGIYPKKQINWENIRNAALQGVPAEELVNFSGVPCMQNILGPKEEELIYDPNESFEIRFGSTGCMLVKRRVFDILRPTVPKYRDQYPNHNEFIDVFFDTSLEGEEYLSEDWHLCNLWSKSGGKVYAAPWVKLNHTGTYVFNGNFMFAQQILENKKGN
jgi:hypothetical protein